MIQDVVPCNYLLLMTSSNLLQEVVTVWTEAYPITSLITHLFSGLQANNYVLSVKNRVYTHDQYRVYQRPCSGDRVGHLLIERLVVRLLAGPVCMPNIM